jgi:hypothetical protein
MEYFGKTSPEEMEPTLQSLVAQFMSANMELNERLRDGNLSQEQADGIRAQIESNDRQLQSINNIGEEAA